MDSNTIGSVWNIKPGPDEGSNPKENTAGKIARPERIDITISKNAIQAELFGIFSFLLR